MWRNVCARHSSRSSAIGSRFRRSLSRNRSRIASVERSEVAALSRVEADDSCGSKIDPSLCHLSTAISFGRGRPLGFCLHCVSSRVLVDSRAIDFMHDAPRGRSSPLPGEHSDAKSR